MRSVVDVPARSGNSYLNSGENLPAFLVHTGDRAISLVQCLDGTASCGQKPRLRPDRYRFQHSASVGIYRGDHAALKSGDPNNAIAENWIVGAGRKWNFLAHGVG